MRSHVLAAQHRPAQVDLQHAIPVLGAHLGHCFDPFDAGIVDQNIDLAEAIDDLLHHGADAVLIGDITTHAEDLPAVLAQFSGYLIQIGLRAAGDRHVRTGARQRTGNRTSQPLAAARDHGHLCRQIKPRR